jgi:nitrate/TMAO reductase-like tetraheme cytochrome c subunit
VLALLVAGFVIGSVAVIGTQIMVKVTGTNAFCGNTCHSMQWVANEYRDSNHHLNSKGVQAGCHDCHIPHDYPALLFYKAKAGLKDVIGEIKGTISTEEKFNKERKRMAEEVWAEFKANNSANCRTCHTITAAVVKKQEDYVQSMHEEFLQGKMTCIDCHAGIAHKAPD